MGETLNTEDRRAWQTPNVAIELLTPERVEHFWNDISGALEQVPHIWDTHYTLESIRQEVMEGYSQVWAAGPPTIMRLIVFTKVARFPKGKVLQIWMAFGNTMEDYLGALDVSIEGWAREQGCFLIEIIGRRGWYAKLKASGFTRRVEIIMRPIENRRIN